jgi:hypothetical protein
MTERRSERPVGEVQRRGMRVQVVRLPGDRAMVTGTPAAVGDALMRLQRAGRLASSTTPQPNGEPGQVMATCRLLPELQRLPVPRRRRLAGWVWAAVAGVGLAVLAGIGWLIYALVAAAADHIALIIGALLVAAVVLGGVGRACTTVITIRHHH